MEGFLIILEIALYGLDAIGIGADIFSWFRGRDNRVERRSARRAGEEVPPRDKWNKLVIILSITVAILTTALLIWKGM
ncbi:MAG: hypothetical protein P1U89_06095 [Verrucomicrobiales bacterium]|nr:hypothetical protein [Verrucomicrobiales bacterium]